MHALLSTDKQKYYQLMTLVCEDLTTTAVDQLVHGGHYVTTAQLTAVRQGQRIGLPLLVDLMRAGLTYLIILLELLPATALQPLFDELAH